MGAGRGMRVGGRHENGRVERGGGGLGGASRGDGGSLAFHLQFLCSGAAATEVPALQAPPCRSSTKAHGLILRSVLLSIFPPAPHLLMK